MSTNENMDETTKYVQQPKDFKINLYKHQLANIYRMEERESTKTITQRNDTIITTNIGVNAELTGYGKTAEMIALILRDKMKWDMNEHYTQVNSSIFAGGKIQKNVHSKHEKLNVTLILASQSIIWQWEKELKCTPLRILMLVTKRSINRSNVNDYDVVLVTPTMYNMLMLKYYNLCWKRFIYDEPGHMKISGMRYIIAGFYWFVTATPNSIIHKHNKCRSGFVHKIFGTINWMTDFREFEFLIVKNSEEFTKQSFVMPLVIHHYHKCHNPMFKVVEGFISSSISEMISAGNINGAIKELGGTDTDNIIELTKQRKMEEIELTSESIKKIEMNTRLGADIKSSRINSLKASINKLENQLKEIDNRYKTVMVSDCNICMDSIKNPVMEPSCQNIFCGKCFFEWLKTKKTCPLCRNTVNLKQLVYIKGVDEKNYEPIKRNQEKTKANTIIELIENKPSGKFIIFSSHDETFGPIRNVLKSVNIGFTEVKGTANTRNKTIESFKNGEVNVIFLNSKFNGSGINLQEASDIIIYHDMTDDCSTLTQVIGRANRIGRKESLHVHYLQL